MRTALIGSLAVAVLLSGCANLLSIHRQRNITPAGAGLGGGAEITLIDAKQRAVISTQRMGKGGQARTVVCAEPSPDALQAIAASSALSYRDAEDRLAQIATQISEQASSIGLRTQSIQLLRDAMYRICEGYAAHAIDDDEVTMLHRRYQNLMLGLLAIEQLTGAVAASQVVLNTSGAAAVGAAATELAAARTDLATAQDAVATAEGAAVTANANHQTAMKTRKEKEGELAAAHKDGDAADIQAAATAYNQAVTEENKASGELAKANSSLEAKRKQLQEATRMYAAAQGKVSASTGGSGSFNGGKGLTSAAATDSVAQAVRGIVDDIVTKSFLYEACFGYITRLTEKNEGSPAANRMQYAADIMAVCKDNMRTLFSLAESSAKVRAAQAEESAARAKAAKP